MKVIYKGGGLERFVLQGMPPWALDDCDEEQLEELPIHL
jgi:hypothetical protein